MQAGGGIVERDQGYFTGGCPSGPRRLRDAPGVHETGIGAAAINPFGAEWLKKTGSAIGESEACA